MLKDVVIDGFTLNPAVRPVPYNYAAACLGQMEVLRRANLYRARVYVCPDDAGWPIAAYDTFEIQIQMLPDSYLWGVQYTEFAAGTYTQVAGGNGLVQITDACTGLELYSEYASGNGITFFKAVPDLRGDALPHLLTQPRLIQKPGLVNIEISNRDSAALRCQLLVMVAEPCVVVQDSPQAENVLRRRTA